MLSSPTATLPASFSIAIPDPAAMDALGSLLAGALGPGDLVAVSGPLGAGKSQLCRAVVRALLGDAGAEVPSPSYTLVNVYPASRCDVWHADLYRLSEAEELAELGLEDAADNAIVLVEWPERWAGIPPRRLDVAIAPRPDDSRLVEVTPRGHGWERLASLLKEPR